MVIFPLLSKDPVRRGVWGLPHETSYFVFSRTVTTRDSNSSGGWWMSLEVLSGVCPVVCPGGRRRKGSDRISLFSSRIKSISLTWGISPVRNKTPYLRSERFGNPPRRTLLASTNQEGRTSSFKSLRQVPTAKSVTVTERHFGSRSEIPAQRFRLYYFGRDEWGTDDTSGFLLYVRHIFMDLFVSHKMRGFHSNIFSVTDV